MWRNKNRVSVSIFNVITDIKTTFEDRGTLMYYIFKIFEQQTHFIDIFFRRKKTEKESKYF